MNERIKKLREQSLSTVETISAERALLVTDYYKSTDGTNIPTPIRRANALKHIFSNKFICIVDDELIVGERGPEPKATPTYPEICLHSEDDLRILNDRDKVSFKSDEETRKAYKEVITPYWEGKTIREDIFNSLPEEWQDAYAAGIFTEFQEQRAPGHTVCGEKIYKKGCIEFKKEIEETKKTLNPDLTDYYEKMNQLEAMDIVADALLIYSKRHAEKLLALAEIEHDSERKEELLQMAEICRNVPANAPKTFHEALQYYWFVHQGVVTELNPWDSFNPGRLDRHLYPFYKKDIEKGILTKQKAVELLQAFWIKFNNHPSPPKIGVTALESSTYSDFSLINIGGLHADGSDAVNELSYIILDVVKEMQQVQPSAMVQISKKNPDSFVSKAVDVIKTGLGQPSCFNTDAIVKQLTWQGKDIKDARNGGASGCVETGAFGTESYILTGYFNLAKIFEITLNNGFDERTQKQIGLKTGNVSEFDTFDKLLSAFQSQVNHFASIKLNGNDIIEQLYAKKLPVPFLSLIIDDCIKNATDYNNGGARYNTSYVQGVGLGSLTDIMTAIRYHIYDHNNLSMDELQIALENNFEGYEKLRYELLHKTPKYGNDDSYADQHTLIIFETFFNAINGKPTPRGGVYRINMLPTTSHVYFGSVMGASADGRKANKPLSEGISPVQGADYNGPTAVVKSASYIDHLKTGGTLLNMKFTPDLFEDDYTISKVVSLIRSYFKMDGHHIQFNVTNKKILLEAQKSPELHPNLIVRVAGYSDYFRNLSPDLQNEIIDRTEHTI